jgi:5'-3' exoribonuclease 1
MVSVSGRALGKITSSFMVLTSDRQKINLGLSIKFEAKSMKVIDYSRKDGRSWEYSQRALDLIKEYKVWNSVTYFLRFVLKNSPFFLENVS